MTERVNQVKNYLKITLWTLGTVTLLNIAMMGFITTAILDVRHSLAAIDQNHSARLIDIEKDVVRLLTLAER